MIAALVLYGSRARGDYRPKSDVDLLAVVEKGPIRNEKLAGGVSLFSYPANVLIRRSVDGDLFALHLMKEGKILHDTFDVFKNAMKQFSYKEDYIDEMTDAYCVCRFLFSRKSLLAKREVRNRLVWAMRTLIIARAAEARQPVFSSADIARFAGIAELKGVIDNRNQKDVRGLDMMARRVAKRWAEDRVEISWPADKEAQRQLMRDRGGVAADTLKFVQPKTLIKKTTPSIGVETMATSFSYE